MLGNTSLIHSPGADATYRTHWWNCYFSSGFKSPLSLMLVKWNAENMWHVSPLSSLISHSSLDAFLKDHRNVSFKTCLVNFLDPEAYASNLSNFLFSIALWNSFFFLLVSNSFQIKAAATAHSILWCRLWVRASGTLVLTGWNYMCPQATAPGVFLGWLAVLAAPYRTLNFCRWDTVQELCCFPGKEQNCTAHGIQHRN